MALFWTKIEAGPSVAPLLVIFLAEFSFLVTTQEVGFETPTTVCQSLDLRNNLQSLEKLRGCQVIEGYLQILLIDNVNETELEQLSFPELVEITDYLLLFRVYGLRSVGQLFPNLAMIRGQNLFTGNKAIIIFEMSKLEEIGLHSLTHILRGSVHIDKNPSLCYIHTIDWDRIIRDRSTPFLKSFKPDNECPVCPESVEGKACPRAPGPGNNFYCWNNEHCQKICHEGCDSCNNRGQCCDANCVGSCDDNNVKQCTICKHFEVGRDENGALQCAEKCPAQFLSYLDRKCVTREECIRIPAPLGNNEIKFPYKVFNDSCILECPTNYANDYKEHTCQKCNKTCRKNCQGASIDSINLAKQFKGCTHITSSLEIQIRGGNKVVRELEENLSMIEEIEGYLKIVRSFSLVSLDFLKNLKRIGGKFLENNKYSLVILDNQNLLDIWDWTNRTLKIDNGTLFFHFNPKLCYSKIEKLITIANKHRKAENKEELTISDLEVARNSNGDKIACDVVELKVKIVSIESKAALLEWPPFRLEDSRKLLGYTVYSIAAPNKTINFYDGRDACGQDNWHVDDVRSNPDVTVVQHPLTNLLPYTQYAFYIRTYTIASENRGAQSNIIYFTTKPSQPVMVKLTVTSNSSDSLYLKWTEPLQPNGKITHYIVSGKKKKDLLLDNKRDYCKDPTKDYEEPKSIKNINTPIKNDTCPDYNKDNEEGKNSVLSYEQYERDEWNRIKFEDALQNQVYVKRLPVRRKRDTIQIVDKYSNISQINKQANSVPNSFPSPNYYTDNSMKFDTVKENKTEKGTNIWEEFRIPIYGKREFYINNLHHFTYYDISVQACRERIPDDEYEHHYCSTPDRQIIATLKKSGADNITYMEISSKTLNTVTVTWKQPADPNGQVVSVLINYKREDTENAQPNRECISYNDFKKYSSDDNISMKYTLRKLYPGNYSVCLKATSLAGDGEYQICKYFIIDKIPNYAVVITISVLLVLFLGVAGAAYWMYRKNLKERERTRRLIPDINLDYATIYVPDDWEVPRKKIELVKELGQGSFGMVWEGVARDVQGHTALRCAVKTVNEHATERERSEFLKEASVMKAFDTNHVVKLIGVVSQGQPTLVIMELMTNGDLKTYLRSLRPDVHTYDQRSLATNKHEVHKPPTLKQILEMAIEIADGMAYLENKKFVHRDLAARNCMVAEDLTVKIGDFGMTRDIYETDYYRKGTKGLLPVRWMAPESLKDGVFSSNSDVWSYGVVLWEMATLASQPYQGLSNDQVLRYVIDGGVMERPENCPDKLYSFMRYCWQPRPSARPSFMKLCQLLLADAKPNFPKMSFYHSPAGTEARRVAKLQAPPSPPQGSEPDVPHVDPSSPLRRKHLGSGYTPSESQESDEIHIDTHHHFPSITEEPAVNGYVGARMRNGGGYTGNNHSSTLG